MKRFLLALLPVASAAGFLARAYAMYEPLPLDQPAEALSPARVPVVVELFTSEGCSSCPAADEALRELAAAQPVPGVEIIALGQHVDYWNRLGWKDKFSSPQFTARQRAYAERFGEGNYTPQAVVNGRYQLVGSQRGALVGAISRAAQAAQATVALSRTADGNLRVQVSHLPAGTKTAQVALALTETGLASQVGRGENAGRLLQHAPLVRTWRPLGTVGATGTFTARAPLALDASWQAANLQAVVLVQAQDSRQIIGASSLPLTQRPAALR